jgi:hypothetical protein
MVNSALPQLGCVEGTDMDNPTVKRGLIDSILELREEVERRLQKNKYYVAMIKLDELLAAIRPLEIEDKPNPVEHPSLANQSRPLSANGGHVAERVAEANPNRPSSERQV